MDVMRATVLVAAGVLVGATVASAAPTAGRTISLLSKTTGSNFQDAAPSGPSKGDMLSGTSQLRNAVAQFGRPKGAVVGRDAFRAVYTSAGVATLRVTVTLPGGTIKCSGTVYDDRSRNVLRVTAGTGSFARATGTCSASPAARNPYGADSLNVYRLQLPG